MDLFKDIVDVAESIAIIAAVLVGGVWAYLIFVRTRQKFPRANIAHTITHHAAGNGKTLIHVDVTIKNVGDVLLSLVKGQTRVQQIYPIPDQIQNLIDNGLDPVEKTHTEVNWPLAGDHCDRTTTWESGNFEIEPNESDDVNCDFIINSDITSVKVYSYFTNVKKRKNDIGWGLTTVYDLSYPDTA